MDEPTQGLDPQTRNHLWSYIKNLNQTEKLTVFFTTHYIEEAEKMANLVAVIDHGQIVATGSPKELIKQTNTSSLEEAFLQLTGHDIRADEASAIDHLRQMRQMRRR
jgi:ABC-2 type transport system ATP-binding protein